MRALLTVYFKKVVSEWMLHVDINSSESDVFSSECDVCSSEGEICSSEDNVCSSEDEICSLEGSICSLEVDDVAQMKLAAQRTKLIAKWVMSIVGG
jgi:hypothetical protein